MKSKKISKRASLWILAAAAVFLTAALVCGFFLVKSGNESCFRGGTVIGGVDCSKMKPSEAAGVLRERLDSTVLQLCREDGSELVSLPVSEVLDSARLDDGVNSLLAEQAASVSALKSSGEFNYDIPCPVREDLEDFLRKELCGEGYVAKEAEDARLELEDGVLRIVPETDSNIPDTEVFARTVRQAWENAPVADGETRMLAVAGGFAAAGTTAKDLEESAAMQRATDFSAQEVTLNFCRGISYTLTAEDLMSVVLESTFENTSRVIVNREQLRGLLDRIIEELGVDGVRAKYGNVFDTREFAYLLKEDMGFPLDREALLDDTFQVICGRKGGTVDGRYNYMKWLNKEYWWMGDIDTVVEISLDNQYLWFYKDGQLMTDTPVTTGDIATGHGTHKGTFYVTGMQADTFLNGPTWHYHVDYWMPFDLDIGLHDAYWQEHYGGDWYLENGSHGCVNTPLDSMKIIFENSFVCMPVIVR